MNDHTTELAIEEALQYANKRDIILSLLYDMGLMPEQSGGSDIRRSRMLNVILHFYRFEEQLKKEPCSNTSAPTA